VMSQVQLGRMYERGQGIPKDNVQAYMWWNLAAAHGDKKAMTLREFVATQMTPGQIAEAQRLATEWKSERSQTPDTRR